MTGDRDDFMEGWRLAWAEISLRLIQAKQELSDAQYTILRVRVQHLAGYQDPRCLSNGRWFTHSAAEDLAELRQKPARATYEAMGGEKP